MLYHFINTCQRSQVRDRRELQLRKWNWLKDQDLVLCRFAYNLTYTIPPMNTHQKSRNMWWIQCPKARQRSRSLLFKQVSLQILSTPPGTNWWIGTSLYQPCPNKKSYACLRQFCPKVAEIKIKPNWQMLATSINHIGLVWEYPRPTSKPRIRPPKACLVVLTGSKRLLFLILRT